MADSLAVVIPTWNEGEGVGGTLRGIQDRIVGRGVQKIVVVDASNTTDTTRAAEIGGAHLVVQAPTRGRGTQMNRGASACEQDVLLFLHADCIPPEGYDEGVRRAMRNGKTWGAFESLDIQGKGWMLRCVEMGVKWRTRLLGAPYGDQGIFVRRDAFQNEGGYREPVFLEDLELTRRLKRKHGKPSLVPASMTTSARRWKQVGVLRSVLINQCILLAYAAGVPAQDLESWYRDPERKANGKTLHGMGRLAKLAMASWTAKLPLIVPGTTKAAGCWSASAKGKAMTGGLE